jgi:acyl-homoserine lactone acylase PvdQ
VKGKPAAVVTLALMALPSAALAEGRFDRQAWSVLPPGQAGSLPPVANSTNQIPLYDGLTPRLGNVTARDLPRYFKPNGLHPTGRTTREKVPMRGVRVVRDRWGVPHVYARTRAGVEFGAGWVTAADRGLFIELLRGPARIAALDVPGLSGMDVATSLRDFEPSAQTEAFIDRQARVLRRMGRPGRKLLRDVDAYIAGINAYRRANGPDVDPWTRRDALAINALIGQVFGAGGGREARSSQFLAELQQRLGVRAGTGVWRDLRSFQDKDAPTTAPGRFSYPPVPSGADGSRIVDPGSLDVVRAKEPAARDLMSNALLVGARRSRSGHPLAVMGPQVGYFYPQFLMEIGLHGGGLDARGAAFPGISLYVLLGRGKDFTWSATSANSDNRDNFLEELCDPDGSPPTEASTSYRFRGECRPMTEFDAGTLAAGDGEPERRIRFRETVHGPVIGTATVDGRPYAVSMKRSTRGREPVSGIAFQKLNENRVRTVRDFPKVMHNVEYTFNWLYADSRNIAMYSSGRLPRRHPRADPNLPTLGTGNYEWRGFLSRRAHPQAINPRSGVLLNWNNKPAPAFGAADDNWSYGSVQRVEAFKGLKRKNRLHDVVGVMNAAATRDLKATEVWPAVRRVLAGGPAPDPLTQQAADLVTRWSRAGASRIDADNDGKVDAPGAAILDAAYPRIANTVLEPVLGDLTEELARLHTRSDEPDNQGNAYGSGWYGYIEKDLRTQLGDRVRTPYSRRYCGNGDLAACRASLWAALQAATNELATAQGPDPAAWRADATRERIVFDPGLLEGESMRWSNRPTYQQVMEFRRHR